MSNPEKRVSCIEDKNLSGVKYLEDQNNVQSVRTVEEGSVLQRSFQ